MAGADESTESFDPRSWTGAVGQAPARPAPESDSFDPASWIAAPDAPASAPPEVPPVASGPRRLAAAGGLALALLAAGAGAAFLSNRSGGDVAAPTVQEAQPAAPAAKEATSRLTVSIEDAGQILPTLLGFGIAPDDAQRAAGQALAALGGAPGELRVEAVLSAGEPPALVTLDITRADGSGIALARNVEGSFTAQPLARQLTRRIDSARGEMDRSSFYSSAVTAGIPDTLISDFAAAFSFDVDFQREISPGDVFEAAFEQDYNPAGEAVGAPRLLFVSLRLSDKSLRFYRFKPPAEAEAAWFDGNGRSNVRSLMRTPVDGARVSSQFGVRIHPISGYKKQHRGTDFAAPTGTPVYASGSATVTFAAPRGSAGNLIQLQHDNGWLTKYMHLDAFAPGIVPGTRVGQGQQIGDVGTTGGSTGPHLHYEVWIEGEPVDPLSIDTGTGTTLSGEALEAFRAERDRIDLARSQRRE